MMKKSFLLLLLSTGLMSHCLKAAQAEPSDEPRTVPGKLGTRLEMFEKQVDPVPSLIPSSLSPASAHQTAFSTAPTSPVGSQGLKKKGPPVSPRPGRSTTTALPTAIPPAVTEEPVVSLVAPIVGAAEPFVSSITRDEILFSNAVEKAEMPALTAKVVGTALATKNQQDAALRVASELSDDVFIIDRNSSGVKPTVKETGRVVIVDEDSDDEDSDDEESATLVREIPMKDISIVLSGADTGVAAHEEEAPTGQEEASSGVASGAQAQAGIKQSTRFAAFARVAAQQKKVRDLLDTINRRRQLEEAEGEFSAGDAVWLLAPENQDEVLRKQILQVIGDNHDTVLSSLTAYFEVQKQNFDDVLYGYINQLISPSQSGDEAQALVKDIKRFDRARKLLVEQGTQVQTLDALITRHKEQLKTLTREWQAREHVAELQPEQIKECLRKLVNEGLDYFLSDEAARMLALKFGDLQASLAEQTVSSPIVNEIFTSANKKFNSLKNSPAMKSQDAGFFGVSHRPGVMRIETELSTHVSQLKTEIQEILQQNGQVMLTPVQLQALVQTAMLASGANDELRVKLRDDEIKTIAARIGELYESE